MDPGEKPALSRSLDQAIQSLQELLLESVLLAKPLPELKGPVNFPDIALLRCQQTVCLLEENLAGPISIVLPSQELVILNEESLALRARSYDELVYLRFNPAEKHGDRIKLSLEARMVSRENIHSNLGLSSLHVEFREVSGKWVASSEPVYLAN